jgi:hypothetical protein
MPLSIPTISHSANIIPHIFFARPFIIDIITRPSLANFPSASSHIPQIPSDPPTISLIARD